MRPVCAPHDPHDRPVGLASPYCSLLNTRTVSCVVITAYSVECVCGQHNAVRLLRLYVLLTC